MEFELTEEQQQIKTSVREFAEAEIAPHVMEWDEAQHFPIELQPKLAELGLTGVLFPEEYGGAGMGYVEYATIIEELSRSMVLSESRSLPIIRFAQITSTSSGRKHKKQKYPGSAGKWRTSGRLGSDRTERRLGRFGHAIDGRA